MAELDIEHILASLSTQEKIDLLSGSDFRHSTAIPRLHIPSLKISNGPSGVTGSRMFDGTPSACFPCGTALGATWDTSLLLSAGHLMGSEAISKASHVVLGPCVNIQRSPLGGRGFESYSEDPLLSGMCAAAMIKGIQEKGVVACIKHFVGNDQEHERGLVDVLVTERALREVYLKPFEIAVREAKVGMVMAAYNRVNGVHVSENRRLLRDVLREEWGWKGVVVSDWFGTYSTSEAINNGLTLEMPGEGRWRGLLLNHALQHGKVEMSTIDEHARDMLNLVHRCRLSGIKPSDVERTRDIPETAALLRKLAADSIVLLKNEKQFLPLKRNRKTLVLGAHAKTTAYCGGGSSSLVPYYVVSPLEGILSKLDSNGDLMYSLGAYAHKELPLLSNVVKTPCKKDGVRFSLYTSPPSDLSRQPVDVLYPRNTDMFLLGFRHPKIKSPLWWVTVDCVLTPEFDCEYEFGLTVYGTGKLFIDGHLVVDNETTQTPGGSFFGIGTGEVSGTKMVQAGQDYAIRVEYASAPSSKLLQDGRVQFPGGGIRIGGAPKINAEEEIKKAVSLAVEAEQVILCAGLNSDWECEGHDRQHMDLPEHLSKLISAVTAANRNTVVVMQSGTPLAMPWIHQPNSVVQAWYGGNECGNAIADVLFGDVNPSGKLPLSMPVRVQDNPAYLSFRSEARRTLYSEDVYVGYRCYEAVEREVLFPFGHGLSYTSFRFSELSVRQVGGQLQVEVDVENTGDVTGAEVVQVYVTQTAPSIRRPVKELRGFEKVMLTAKSKERVKVSMGTKYATSFWDELADCWVMEKGTYTVLVGNSSACQDMMKMNFEIESTRHWKEL